MPASTRQPPTLARNWRRNLDVHSSGGSESDRRLHGVSFFSRRLMLASGVIGVIGLALLIVAGLANASAFFQPYLLGYTFWLGLGLGSLGVVLVQFLTGGNWG